MDILSKLLSFRSRNRSLYFIGSRCRFCSSVGLRFCSGIGLRFCSGIGRRCCSGIGLRFCSGIRFHAHIKIVVKMSQNQKL
ncbi:unnamed protein product [Cochlearia groenlandica]